MLNLPELSCGSDEVGMPNAGPTPQINFDFEGERNSESVMSEVPDSGNPPILVTGSPRNGRMNRKIRFQLSFSVIGTTGWTFSRNRVLSNGPMCTCQLNWNGMLTRFAIGLAS